MDKAKTLEVLKGMKFMQRKEEAKRRAMYEIEQSEHIEKKINAAKQARDGAQSQAPKGPTIIFDHAFPLQWYHNAHHKYAPFQEEEEERVGAVGPTTTSGDGEGGDAVEEAVKSMKRKREEEAQPWGSEGSDDDNDGSSVDGEGEEDDDPTVASATKREEKRFYVPDANHAPQLPKRLKEAEAERLRRKAQEREKDDEDDLTGLI